MTTKFKLATLTFVVAVAAAAQTGATAQTRKDPTTPTTTAGKGGWTPLYLATDNRNIESGDYPVRKGDMDHLDYIKILIAKGANVNARMKDSTQTRTVFTNQWLDENGATAFLRASRHGGIARTPRIKEIRVIRVIRG